MIAITNEQISHEIGEQMKDAVEKFGEPVVWCIHGKHWWPKVDCVEYTDGRWACERCREHN